MTVFSPLAPLIAKNLIAAEQTVSVAESSTGGLIAANLLSVPGASSYFIGGAVVYTLKSRKAYLDFDKERLKGVKPMTEEMVMEFARAAREKLGTTWGIAELGIAGPSGTPYGFDAGNCVIAVSGPKNASIKIETKVKNREENMIAFTQAALRLFADTLGD